jgi:dolichol-phosphate mannosyltransferase
VQAGAELAIIVPTYEEAANMPELVRRLDACLKGVQWELIIVDDDSADGTARIVRELGRTDGRVRCLQRLGRRGLSSACVEGMLATTAPFLAVMDGDLQHDESLLPAMLAALRQEGLDVVIGSRYVPGGSSAGLQGQRVSMSRVAASLSRPLIPEDLNDPMSGFFMLRRQVFDSTVRRLSGIGFKILVDFFASAEHPLHFRELPYQFRSRYAGESKLDAHAVWDYGMLLLDKFAGRFVSPRLLVFLCIGGLGVLVHFAVLATLFRGLGVSFVWSQATATLVAMTGNYALNNEITYRDLRLRGWQWLRGWSTFVLACGIGALANVGVAQYVFDQEAAWALAGLAGILVGAIWNYVITLVYTWRGAAH